MTDNFTPTLAVLVTITCATVFYGSASTPPRNRGQPRYSAARSRLPS
jgi:hypothetical protein